MDRRCIGIPIPISQRIREVIADIRTADILHIAVGSIAPGAIRIDGQRPIFGIDRDTIDRIDKSRDSRTAAFRRIADFCDR